MPAALLKKTLWKRCFLVNFVKFLNTFFITVLTPEHHLNLPKTKSHSKTQNNMKN